MGHPPVYLLGGPTRTESLALSALWSASGTRACRLKKRLAVCRRDPQPVTTQRNVKCAGEGRFARALEKTDFLRQLCGGRLHKWLTRWRARRGMQSTPWPGWPASRLTLARYAPENFLSLYMGPHTMGTTTWPLRWKAELRRRWSRSRYSRDIPDGCRTAASRCQTHWKRSTTWHARCEKSGAGRFAGSPGQSVRLQPKRSWRHCLARSSGS